jgi:hypothetical protein
VVQKHFVAAKLTGDDPPTTAEYLKLLLSLYADANFETLYGLKRIVEISNRVVATNDNNGPT